jgi:hypothetical protein
MSLRHPEWRDDHEFNNYPFADDATLTNGDDTFQQDTFEDAAFYAAGAQATGYISRVNITGDIATFYIGDELVADLVSGTLDLTAPSDHIRFVDSSNRPGGLIVSTADKLAIFQSWTSGDHFFTPDQTEFVAQVWMPTPGLGLQGFQADDGQILTGDVYLVGDDGVQLSCDEVTIPASCGQGEETQYVVKVDIQGDPLWRRRECAPGFFSTPRFVERITFQKGGRNYVCGPGTKGDIKFYVNNATKTDTILRIRPEAKGLRIETVGEALEDIR